MSLPSVLLHDHLDGGLRPATVLELADEIGYDKLPADNVDDLANWFDQGDSGSLERYLESFDHTLGVMQTAEAIERVAYEAAIDLGLDGVVYAELRFSPPQHTTRGLSPLQVIEAVSAGLRMGSRESGLEWNLIIDSLRHLHDASDMARLALSARHLGVVSFDLAGPEAGFPPDHHLAGCRAAAEGGLRLTIHAGEAGGREGVANIASSINRCSAERIGHGIELINDCIIEDGDIVELGPVATMVRNKQILLEVCPASNLATRQMEPEDHPVGPLHRAGFNVTLNTDGRLMASTSMSDEFDFVCKYHGFEIQDLALVTRRAVEGAFCDWETKQALWEDRIAPDYAAAGAEVERKWI